MRSIAQRGFRRMVYFDQQAIGARSNGGACHGRNLVTAAGSVRWVGQNRKMRELLDDRNGRNVQRVARVVFKCTNATLAEHHVVVPARHDVLGREKPFFNRCRRPALQENRLADLRQFLQQIEVLHVACPDLQDIDLFAEKRNLRVVHNFRNHKQAVLVRRFPQHLQTLFAHTLETVGRGSRLERAAAENAYAVFLHDPGNGHDLFGAFDGAWPGHHHHVAAAHFDLVSGSADFHNRPIGPECAARQLV